MTPEDEATAWTDVDQHLRRYGRSGSRPKTLQAVINQVMAKRGYNQRQSNRLVEDAWKEVAPSQWMGQTKVGKLSRGTLQVIVDNPATLQEITFIKHLLLGKLQQVLGTQIKSIRFTLG